MILLRIIILLALLTQPAFTQNKNIKQQKYDLRRLRAEIEQFKTKLQNESVKESTILDMLSAEDREIDLTHALIEQLKREEQKNSKSILKVAYELKSKREELDRLKEVYKTRLVNFYKYGRLKDIELLLTAKSFNQVILWIKYQKLLAANDRRNYHNILKKKMIIENKKNELKNELITKRKIIQEKAAQEKILKQRKKEREKLLATVRQNKQLYLQKLKQYEASAREIERLISVEEERRIALGRRGVLQETNFPRLKGKMIWPTRGQIITKFGRYTHPKLKTITESIGIDIKTEFGEEVHVVGEGVVTAITWQRGRGNIVIVNHYGGFYTVYTHLSKIFVQINEKVQLGQIIGEVGDSGSLRGSMLHFEIWKNNKVLDPEQWLS